LRLSSACTHTLPPLPPLPPAGPPAPSTSRDLQTYAARQNLAQQHCGVRDCRACGSGCVHAKAHINVAAGMANWCHLPCHQPAESNVGICNASQPRSCGQCLACERSLPLDETTSESCVCNASHHNIVKLTLGYILLSPECHTSFASVSSFHKDLCCVKIAHLCWQLVLKGSRLLQKTAVLSDLVKRIKPVKGWCCQGVSIGATGTKWAPTMKHTRPVRCDRQVSYQLCSLYGLIKPFNFPFASGVVCSLVSL